MPIDADGWIYINCLWVAGSLKGHGHSGNLLSECIRDAKEQGAKAFAFSQPRVANESSLPIRSFCPTRVSK